MRSGSRPKIFQQLLLKKFSGFRTKLKIHQIQENQYKYNQHREQLQNQSWAMPIAPTSWQLIAEKCRPKAIVCRTSYPR